jgi:hypothetical protein
VPLFANWFYKTNFLLTLFIIIGYKKARILSRKSIAAPEADLKTMLRFVQCPSAMTPRRFTPVCIIKRRMNTVVSRGISRG